MTTWTPELSNTEAQIASDTKRIAQETADRLIKYLPILDFTGIEVVLDWIMEFTRAIYHSEVTFDKIFVVSFFKEKWPYQEDWNWREKFANDIIEKAIVDLEKDWYINLSLTDQILEWIGEYWARKKTKTRTAKILDTE